MTLQTYMLLCASELPLPFPRAFYRGMAGAPAMENGLWGLAVTGNPTGQLQFLPLCIAEGSLVLPGSEV